MIFNSYFFIFSFLPLSILGFYILEYFFPKRLDLRIILLLGMSLWFYAYFKLIYILILISSLAVNYIFAYAIENIEDTKIARKHILYTGLFFNIGLLGFFKYTNFLLENIKAVFPLSFHIETIILPLGISFFTFQQISFLVDIYKKEVKLENFFRYSFFVCFFPQFVAGPIVQYKEIMPQLHKQKPLIIWDNLNKGIFLFTAGLFKKVVIADFFALTANRAFDMSSFNSLSSLDAWVGSLSYTFQLYFDFSGYCDMAMGLAFLFNIKLPFNFLSPYKAKNIGEFWRNWHITLGRFLREYLYIPLGGSRGKDFTKERNLLIVFLISGIWHGANWTFIIWGLCHGLASALHSLWGRTGKKMHSILAWILTFSFINLTWVIFRSPNFNFSLQYLKRMFSPQSIKDILALKNGYISTISPYIPSRLTIYSTSFTYSLLLLSTLFFCLFGINQKKYLEKYLYTPLTFPLVLVFIVGSMFLLHKPSPFLYFNF